MKKTALILALMLSTLMLTACGSKYIAVTKDYTIYIGTKKPVINPENDSVSFEDDTGKTHTIPREDLKQVRPLPSHFLPDRPARQGCKRAAALQLHLEP